MYDPSRGYPRIVPYLTYVDVEDAVRWLVHVFHFKVHVLFTTNGRVRHAELRHGADVVLVSLAGDRFGPVSAITQIFVDDVDRTCNRAVAAGGEMLELAVDEPWGLRQAVISDPGGMRWEVSQHLRDVPPEEWGGELVEPFPFSGRSERMD
jgi:PhnB protein